MSDSREIYWYATEDARRNRQQLKCIIVVCGFNVFMLMCYACHFRWWEKHLLVLGIMSFVYLFYIVVRCDQARGSLFSEGIKRLKHWRDFYRSRKFIRSRYDYRHAPIGDGDYVVIFRECDDEYGGVCEYMKFHAEKSSRSQDIYKFSLVNIKKETEQYTSESYDCCDNLFQLQKDLEADGFSIIRVDNKYGDTRWEQSQEETKPCMTRKIIYKVIMFFWYAATLLATLAPTLPLWQAAKASSE